MVDLNQFLNVAVLALLVGLLVEVFKAKIEPADRPYAAILFGVALAVLFGLALKRIGSSADLVSFVIGGLFAGVSAAGAYDATLDRLKKFF